MKQYTTNSIYTTYPEREWGDVERVSEREEGWAGLLYAISRWIMDACNQSPLPTPLCSLPASLSLCLSVSLAPSEFIEVAMGMLTTVRDPSAHILKCTTHGGVREEQAEGKPELLNSADKLGYVEASVE